MMGDPDSSATMSDSELAPFRTDPLMRFFLNRSAVLTPLVFAGLYGLLALCSFICPGKNDYGAVLRVNLNTIELEG